MKTFESAAIFVALLLSIMITASLQAQQSGSIAGNVTDPDGAAIGQAHVTLRRASHDASRDTVTDAEGHFEFRELDPGVYLLTANAPGFQSVSRETGVFSARATKEDLQFQSLVTAEQVTVVASAPDAMSPDPSERTFVHDQESRGSGGRSEHVNTQPNRQIEGPPVEDPRQKRRACTTVEERRFHGCACGAEGSRQRVSRPHITSPPRPLS